MRDEQRYESRIMGVSSRVPAASREIEREAVIAMHERERRSLTASLLAMSVLMVSVIVLPDPAILALFLVLRMCSFLFTRGMVHQLSQRIRLRKPLLWTRRAMALAMALSGTTLALLLWPQANGGQSVSMVMIQVVVIIEVTLIAVTFAAMPTARDIMLASFWAATAAIILFHPAGADPALLLVLTLAVAGIRIYSTNTGLHMRSAAQMLVENRQLSEDLADALAHAEYLSWRDPLTGLYNRRMLFEETRAERSAVSRHLLTIDLDRFKAINDTFGHGVGDEVIVGAAAAIREWCGNLGGNGDHLAFRLGGEEFLVIARGLEQFDVAEAAEDLRMAIGALEEKFAQHPGISISASMGLTPWRFGEGLDDALLRADVACYKAKNTGRNKIRSAA